MQQHFQGRPRSIRSPTRLHRVHKAARFLFLGGNGIQAILNKRRDEGQERLIRVHFFKRSDY
jgi:hypothetical protein